MAEPLVFVVDDDPSYRGFLARLAQSGGWRVETFGTAREFVGSPGTELEFAL